MKKLLSKDMFCINGMTTSCKLSDNLFTLERLVKLLPNQKVTVHMMPKLRYNKFIRCSTKEMTLAEYGMKTTNISGDGMTLRF